MKTVKRTLEAAEKAMNLHPGNVQSEETKAFHLRCGLSGCAEFVPNDCKLMNDIMNGSYPVTMTADDIEQIRQINEAFEEACR